jgi:hypothetical protein
MKCSDCPYLETSSDCQMKCDLRGELVKSDQSVVENKIKPKKCKGTSKAIGYGCNEPQQERIFGLGKKCGCYKEWLLHTPQGQEYLKSVTLKITQPRIDLQNADLENKNRTKLAYLLTNTKNTCHEYIRERDKGKPCVSCDSAWQSSHQAGHFYKSELYSNLRFDEKNLSGQCQQCNLRKEGNESGYRAGIIQRYGFDHLRYLDEKAKAYKQNNFQWDREQLIEIRDYYKQKLKELKK